MAEVATRRHRVAIRASGESFTCAEDTHVLAAMEKARCSGIPVGCRNGGCGACRVRVESGAYAVGKMNRAVVSEADEAAGCVLACRLYPRGDLAVHPLGRAWRAARPSFHVSPPRGLAMTVSTTQPQQET